MKELQKAAALIDDEPDEAHRICSEVLNDDPDNVLALHIVGTIYSRASRHGIALAVFERVRDLVPNKHEAWNNVGMSLCELHRYMDARQCFQKALELKYCANYLANLAVTYMNEGDQKQAIVLCKQALKMEPAHKGAWSTLGFCSLALGDWENGWKGFNHCLGGRFRKELTFQDAPRWDGTKGQTVCVYGEQGIGDEIMYASCLPDMIRDSKQVIVECDQRLEGLFRRSFPEATVYGTRRLEPTWLPRHKLDANCAIGALPMFYRKSPKDCPQTPYLVPDPERRLQWRALFDSWGRKPVIGLCWTGGRQNTQAKARAVGLEALRPVIESIDAHWVSLQYKDAAEEIRETGLPVRHIHRAVQSPDFDDTAAFVAECDIVIGIHTTVHHLAGALGVPSIILVPQKPIWNYAHGDSLPWYKSQRFWRQRKSETWFDCVKRLEASDLLNRYKIKAAA